MALKGKSRSVDGDAREPLGLGRSARKTTKVSTSKKFVLIVGDEGAILVLMQGAKVVRRLFAQSAQPVHTAAVLDIIKANPKVPIYLLADVIDQQYIPHTFPPVSQLSVGGLVKRRLERDFQPDDLTAALPLGRDKSGRKEWKFLLIALAKTALVSSWIDLLVELPNEMKGVYLSPVEAVHYLAMLNRALSNSKQLPWQLLISYNKISGFRQVVLHEGNLVFTRVSQAIDDTVAAVIAGNIEQEIMNTVEYLKRLSFDASANLAVTIIISQDVGESIDVARFGFGSAHILSPIQVAELLGLEQAALSADRFGDVVMAAAFGVAKKQRLRFVTAYISKLDNLRKICSAIRGAAALACVLIVGFAALTMWGMVNDYAAIRTANKKIEALVPKLAASKLLVDGVNKDVALKSAIVSTMDAFTKDVALPQGFIRDIQPFSAQNHRFVAIDWSHTPVNTAIAATTPAEAAAVAVRTEVDFSGAGTDMATLNQVAKEFLARLKSELPQYEITSNPFPWMKEDARQEAIVLDISRAVSLDAKDMVVVINFRGVKAAGGSAPAPLANVVPAQVVP
jgi:hypothetical protein